MAEKKEKTFEDHCRRLDEIAGRLEEEQLPLEESIELFTEGVDLALKARAQLEEGGKKIQKLIEKIEGDFDLEDLDQEP